MVQNLIPYYATLCFTEYYSTLFYVKDQKNPCRDRVSSCTALCYTVRYFLLYNAALYCTLRLILTLLAILDHSILYLSTRLRYALPKKKLVNRALEGPYFWSFYATQRQGELLYNTLSTRSIGGPYVWTLYGVKNCTLLSSLQCYAILCCTLLLYCKLYHATLNFSCLSTLLN